MFIQTSPPHERTFLLKSREKLQEMDEDPEDIHSQNLISYYQLRPKILEKYCLADFAAELRINVPKDAKYESQEFGQINDDDDDDKAEILDTSEVQEGNGNEKILLHLKNSVLIKQQKKACIIIYKLQYSN